MNEKYTKQGKTKNDISHKLVNINFDPSKRNDNEFLFSNRQIMFEQYKLLIESSHKIEERRNGSNNIFLTINVLLSSFLIRPSQLPAQIRDVPLCILLILVGIFISWDWLKVTSSYKKINSANYLLIQAFEKILPTYVFSLRAEIETEKDKQKLDSKTNVILIKENFLPKIFILVYFIYFFTVMSYVFGF